MKTEDILVSKDMTSHIRRTPVETVGEIVTGRTCPTVRTHDKIADILEKMQMMRVSAVGVTDAAHRFVGLLTERDILRKLLRLSRDEETDQPLGLYLNTLTAWDIMNPDPVTVTTDTPVEEAENIMEEHGFRFLPVVGSGDPQTLAGIAESREIYAWVRQKYDSELEKKDMLLSYMMHHESYGTGYAGRKH